MNYIVTDKATASVVYNYQSDEPVEWNGMEFATHDHVPEALAEAGGGVDAQITRMTWTQTAWKRRFSQEERLAIREAAAANAVLSDYMDLMAGATEISNDDSDTVRAVNMLEQAGLIGEGRANEVLHG